MAKRFPCCHVTMRTKYILCIFTIIITSYDVGQEQRDNFFLFSRGKGNLVTDVSMINAKFIYIKYISKNDLTWQWFKHQSIFTLLTFAHICIQCVVGCTCCAIPRNIAVTALIDITSGCKNKIITMSTTSCHCWLFYHIMKRLSRM